MVGFTRCLALEIGERDVTANVVAPGLTQTGMTHRRHLSPISRSNSLSHLSAFLPLPLPKKGMTQDVLPRLQKKVDAGEFGPRKRVGQVEDVVPAFLFLASPEARHMLGQTICPSGGHVMV